jgi:two-component system, cell cycle response regulator
MERELSRSARKGGPLAVLMADLDHFKKINDTYGHEIGDAVLKEAARRIAHCVRAYDSLGRVGGEEFLAVLPDCGAAMALSVAERVGAAVSQTPIETPVGPVSVTVSLGVASTEQANVASISDLSRAADAALYRAKHTGRARACLAVPGDFLLRRSGEQAFPSGAGARETPVRLPESASREV